MAVRYAKEMGAPKVSPDGLKKAYWSDLTTRTIQAVLKTVARQEMTAAGKIIPDDEDLVIGAGRHLAAVVMFTDISGFSGWPSSNQSEQEAVLTALNLYMSETIRIISDYGGEVEKNTGDGPLSYFDVQPGETEEAACKRGLACALILKACTAPLINPILSGSSLPEVRFRVGLDFGWITVARIGSAKLFNSRVAIGSTANVTGKMLEHAGAEDVIIGNNLKSRLPPGWVEHAEILTFDSGFFYVVSGVPYALYRCKGRWTELA